MMSSQSRVGLRNNPTATQYSKKTQDMVGVMMQELRVTYTQRRQINKCLRKGAALPLTFNSVSSSSSSSLSKPKTSKSVQKHLEWRPQIRSAEACRSGNSYVREKFCPGPTRDLEKEKRRLQNILETGQEEPEASASKKFPARQNSEVVECDRYEEVLNEIEDRRQFLADMSALGQEKNYINIINTEISQKIQELKRLKKTSSPEKTPPPHEGRGLTEENLNFRQTDEERLASTI